MLAEGNRQTHNRISTWLQLDREPARGTACFAEPNDYPPTPAEPIVTAYNCQASSPIATEVRCKYDEVRYAEMRKPVTQELVIRLS